ncbi:MAG: redoxin domain-containing protein [Phycisphaerae bacterium]|nr:redoxin domain-containing protein [Saprospiraceae bacterium]
MNKTAFLAFILALSNSMLPAQVRLHGTVINSLGKGVLMMSVEFWSDNYWQPTINASINADNTFDVTLPMATPGQYRLRMFGESTIWSDFIIPDSAMAESSLKFALDNGKMDGGPAPTVGSKANEIYFELMTASRQARQSEPLDPALKELNRRCLDIVARYRKTLLGDIALLLFEPRKEDFGKNVAIEKMTANEFAKAYALAKVPFEHENILHHNAFTKALNQYYDYFEHNEKGNNAFIDGIMARRNGNEAVDGYLFRYLLDKMLDNKSDPSLSYLLKWYTPDCPDDDPMPDYIQNLLVALKTCAPGNLAPDLNFVNLKGQVVNLGAVCAQNQLTMLLFWKSSCSHCKEFEPILLEIYKKYHPLGLEVYALSTDKNEETWRGFLQGQPTPWVNVFIPKEQRAAIGRQYPAPSTPTLMLLDKNRKVVSRVLSRGNLEDYLDGELAKRK